MPTVSEQLRRSREEQKLDIRQVVEITKIKSDHVRALEAGDFDVFIAPVYIRGFVRTYARSLKLDETRIMADLEAELGQSEKFREPPPLTGPHEGVLDYLMLQLSKLTWRMVAVGAGVLIVFWFGLHWVGNRNAKPADPLKSLGPGIYQPKSNQGGEVLPLPAAPGKKG
jgi:cytoskeleton protein RodZ